MTAAQEMQHEDSRNKAVDYLQWTKNKHLAGK
jgi:hypothetical protein